MAHLDLDENKSLYQIRAYKPGIIQVNDKVLHHSIIITPTKLIENWTPERVENLNDHSFDMILEMKPDVLLIGTGEKQIFIANELYGVLINKGIGVELMSTQAACRTYNALSAENRNVVAALIIR